MRVNPYFRQQRALAVVKSGGAAHGEAPRLLCSSAYGGRAVGALQTGTLAHWRCAGDKRRCAQLQQPDGVTRSAGGRPLALLRAPARPVRLG